MGKTNAGISSASFASKKAIQESAKSGARESGYHRIRSILKKRGASSEAKKRRKTDAFSNLIWPSFVNMMIEF